MDADSVFERLVKYYCQVKWPKCAEFVKDGQYKDPVYKNCKIGQKENPFGGALIIANGDTITKKLVDDELVDKQMAQSPVSTKTLDDFIGVMENHADDDGALTYDSVNEQMTFVGLINTKNERLASLAYEPKKCLPKDFTADGKIAPAKIGARTDTAIKVSQAYPHTNVLQVKETIYTSTGMGLVTRLKAGKLAESFFLKYQPGLSPEMYLDASKKVVGVHRTYKTENDEVIVDKEEIVPRSKLFPEEKKEIKRPVIYDLFSKVYDTVNLAYRRAVPF